MPTAILDFDVEHLPQGISVPQRYRETMILLRWRNQPIARLTLPLVHGQVSATHLREAALDSTSDRVLEALRMRYLDSGPGPGPGDAAPAPRATVAVCTRDRPEDLERCLTAIRRLPDDGQEILVIDSASKTDATARICETRGVRCVREDVPGLDRARNRALREARTPIVAFTDDDAVPDPGWLRALCRNFADPRVLAVTGLTMPLELETEAQEWFERASTLSRGFVRRTFDGTSHPALLVGSIGAGANQAFRRDVAQLVSAFDEALDAGTPTKSGGDNDMYTRILAAGYSIVYDPRALSWHRHRREWSELRGAMYGYGVGVYAHWTAQLLRREFTVPRVALGWLRSQLSSLARAILRRPGHIPLDLVLAELLGCAVGPLAYLRSRRQLRGVRQP
ncbi:MAG: glycosyltransferase [Gemmatimonadaceae bacterium]